MHGLVDDYASSPALIELEKAGLVNVTKELRGRNGVGGNYRYRGEWHSLDHVLLSPVMRELVDTAYINDASFLLEDEPQYGGKRPHRSFSGYRYQHGGVSDHLPLVVRFRNPSQEKRGVSY